MWSGEAMITPSIVGVGGERHRIGERLASERGGHALGVGLHRIGDGDELDMGQVGQGVSVKRSHAADTDHTHPHSFHGRRVCHPVRVR